MVVSFCDVLGACQNSIIHHFQEKEKAGGSSKSPACNGSNFRSGAEVKSSGTSKSASNGPRLAYSHSHLPFGHFWVFIRSLFANADFPELIRQPQTVQVPFW